MKLASFDIFDTVLIRKCGKPENIFYLLAHHLYPDDEAKRENFIQWRRRAESQVARRKKERETTITDIYTNNGEESFGEYTPTQLIEAEKSVESENLTANPAIKAAIEQCRAEGKTICFISDMYLDSYFLSQVLKREGCLVGNEKVYVSCEEEARKSTGALFDKVRAYLTPSKWEHYGDHPISDVKNAQKRGINAIWIRTTGYTETEKLLSKQSFELSCLAGLQRTARITAGNNAYATLAADFVAPAYIPYVQFVLNKAKEQGIKRLYFLSRDSYILQRIAEGVQDKYPDIEFKYLFVSRKALLLPYLQKPTAEKFIAVQDKQTLVGKYVEELLSSLGTSNTEFKEKFATEFEYDRITNKQQEKDFLCKLFGEKSNFRQQLQEVASKKRKLLNAYFSQEGIFDGTASAMVDVGWLGTTRLMINSILKEGGHKETQFFYYGVRGDVLDEIHGKYYSYNNAQELSTELTTLIENYFSASPYPSTIGYEKTEKGIVPIFKQGEKYKENKIIAANVQGCGIIAKELAITGLQSPSLLKDWSKQAATDILSLKQKDINLLPLCEAELFDGKDFVKRLNIKELLNIMLLGGRCTAFDKGSIRLTVGGQCFPFIWNICRLTGNIRRFLYLELKKLK